MPSPPRPKKSLTLLQPGEREWKIEKLVPGGAGFVRLSTGQGAFALGALPGERIAVEQAEDHRSYLQATRWTLLDASPARVSPACPVQGQCGGCDLMTLSYPAQLEAKRAMLHDALTRVGRFHDLPEIDFVASELALAYRSRVRLHVAAGGKLGFFAEGSNRLVEIPSCLVADPALDRALLEARAIFARHARAASPLAELELRVAPGAARVSARLVPSKPTRAPDPALLAELDAAFDMSLPERHAEPEHDQRFPLPGGVTLRAPAAAFTQVNWAVNQRLVQALLDGALARGARTFCDLYSGAGNFSLPLLASGLSGVGIESSRPAIAAAQRAADEQRLPGARFVAGDVEAQLVRLSADERFDLIVLDPPRSGARAIVPELLRRAPPSIAYCACDPVTLARDLRALSDGGYRLRAVTGFDMFPQTHHFETLVWLDRSP